jgi:hypothetical protein
MSDRQRLEHERPPTESPRGARAAVVDEPVPGIGNELRGEAPDRGRRGVRAWPFLTLQRRVGNAAVARLLQRQEGSAAGVDPMSTSAPGQTGPAPAAPATGAVAAVQQEAVQTVTRINQAITALASLHSNPTAFNTSQLFRGPTPRLRFTPMTRRSDSNIIKQARGQLHPVAYFFTGTVQPPLGADHTVPPAGTLELRPSVMGTIDGNTVVIRGRYGSGTWRSQEELMGTLIHEASHVLLASYGEHPQTAGQPGSVDRYKDEFRAYFVEQFGDFSDIRNLNERAKAIKKHLVGTGLNDPDAYPDLRNAYWTPPVTNPFRVAVDAHRRPDGFNLTNSIRLDRLFTRLGEAATDATKVDEVMVAITRLTAAERAEAMASRLIRTRAQACGPDANTRIRAALEAPRHAEYTRGLNPGRSPRIARLYEEIARTDPERMRSAYDQLSPAERGDVHLNPATLVFVDHNVRDSRTRACVYAMLTGRSSTQYTAMEEFLDECFFTFIGTYGDPPAGLPRDLRAAVRRISFLGRLAFYRMVEDARRSYVDTLAEPARRPLLAILRGEADP